MSSWREKQKQKLAAAERIIAMQSSIQPKRGRRSGPKEEKSYFVVGQNVETEIPNGLKENKDAIVHARRLISERTGRFYDVVAQYHKQYRQVTRAEGRPSLPSKAV